MRMSSVKYVASLVKFAAVLATLIIGMAFVMVTSVNAAAPDKKIEVNAKEKIEKVVIIVKDIKADNLGSRALIRRPLLNNSKLNNNEVFVKPLFEDLFIEGMDGLIR